MPCAVCAETMVVDLHHIAPDRTIPLCPNHHYAHHRLGLPLAEREGMWYLGDPPPDAPSVVDLKTLKGYVRGTCPEGHPVRVLIEGEADLLTSQEASWLFRRVARLALHFPTRTDPEGGDGGGFVTISSESGRAFSLVCT